MTSGAGCPKRPCRGCDSAASSAYGVNLVSLMVTLREEGRFAAIRIIQWYLETVHQLHLSVGAIVQAVAWSSPSG